MSSAHVNDPIYPQADVVAGEDFETLRLRLKITADWISNCLPFIASSPERVRLELREAVSLARRDLAAFSADSLLERPNQEVDAHA